MTATRNGGLSTATTSRAGSVAAREILKRRDKPYKTETNKILAKKKKLDLHTSYRHAPQGYTFLPVGTPDLAERCKELSRKRGLPVNVVNAKPVSKHAIDPEKVSHHIHRIGYHFRSEIVDEACEKLGYIMHRDHFIKEVDLKAQHTQSRTAQIMAKHGLHINQPDMHETPTQVRAAIKELFPKIPEDDLQQIVKHAWEQGTNRVGTNSMLELPRRVQLATIARIRHAHTDYDSLLRAFEWKEARTMVEPVCLKKLIEWRGESEDEDDNELEEIVRETIVIDDDDDENGVGNGSEADDEDSVAELGHTSDASIEVTHQLAADEDLGAESLDETSRNFLRRYQPRTRLIQQQNTIARQKLDTVRQQIRKAPPRQPSRYMHVPTNERGEAPRTIMTSDGRVLQRILDQSDYSRPVATPQPLPLQQNAYGSQLSTPFMGTRALPSPFITSAVNGLTPHDRPVMSIERDDASQMTASTPVSVYDRDPRRTAYAHRPVTPEPSRSEKRRRVGYSPGYLRPVPVEDHHRPAYYQSDTDNNVPPSRQIAGEIVDLTTPERPTRSARPSPLREVHVAPITYDDRMPLTYAERSYTESVLRGRPLVQTATGLRLVPEGDSHFRSTEPEPYDPAQPLINLSQNERVQDMRPMQRKLDSVPLTAYPLVERRYYEPALYETSYPPQTRQPLVTAPPYQQVVYQQPAPAPLFVQVHTPAPQPVHGAPAPVQQVPRDTLSAGSPNGFASPHNYHLPAYSQYVAVAPPPTPTNGAPHPAQLYQPR